MVFKKFKIYKGVKLIKVIQNSCITLINEVALFNLKAFQKLNISLFLFAIK